MEEFSYMPFFRYVPLDELVPNKLYKIRRLEYVNHRDLGWTLMAHMRDHLERRWLVQVPSYYEISEAEVAHLNSDIQRKVHPYLIYRETIPETQQYRMNIIQNGKCDFSN